MKLLDYQLSKKQITLLEYGIMVLFCIIPLFIKFPFKPNLYLAWEGAYRLSEGQVPFRDFGMPLGYSFWLIPALFFKIFGPYFSSLIKAQAFINFISLITVRGIASEFGLDHKKRFFVILVFCLSYVFINFWPWYNHTVFVFELLAIYFLQLRIKGSSNKWKLIGFSSLSSLFIFLAIFTKQDIGGLGFMVLAAMIVYYSWAQWSLRVFLECAVSFIIVTLLFILPLLPYDFGYWFNFGQEPHYSRLNAMDFLDDFFKDISFVLRLYILAILVIIISKKNIIEYYKENVTKGLHTVFTLGILVEVVFAQVTTYIPANAHFYYHTFAVAYFLTQIKFNFELSRLKFFVPLILFTFLWWSHDFWSYGKRVLGRFISIESTVDYNVVSKRSWRLQSDSVQLVRSQWIQSDMRSINNVFLPKPTLEGIERIKALPVFEKEHPEILNMTELTFLAYEIDNFPLQTGVDYPLWFHVNVAMFEREIEMFNDHIRNKKYDLVLFEHIPDLNEFYPSAVRAELKKNYKLQDSFTAPRSPENSIIEVYLAE